jgi:hypothetical protein
MNNNLKFSPQFKITLVLVVITLTLIKYRNKPAGWLFENEPNKGVVSDTNKNNSGQKTNSSTLHDSIVKSITIPNDSMFVVIKGSDDPKVCSLSTEELKEVNEIFDQCVNEYKKKLFPIESYKRQYFPSINSKGEKEVWVNCFQGQWREKSRTETVIVDDGGKSYFNFKINLKTKKYFDFGINSQA